MQHQAEVQQIKEAALDDLCYHVSADAERRPEYEAALVERHGGLSEPQRRTMLPGKLNWHLELVSAVLPHVPHPSAATSNFAHPQAQPSACAGTRRLCVHRAVHPAAYYYCVYYFRRRFGAFWHRLGE